ncbi:MAG: hypothetical protein BGO97_13285 [Micrococcales bacterium 70-64]|nr:DUF559 domain-containing protein [Leifsonia sp.]ODU64910.1 MAG: hypothetical protein ABT06_13285 [Leifsonia sp. SCN 70-46]OJX86602.1 MAG: hypothetical protein BGO97_13285 [Micrococcales bacterium 70-64]
MPPPLPPEFTDGAFTVGEAGAAGIPRSRLRRSDLVSPFAGVRAWEQPLTPFDRCLAYAPRLRPGQAFSHISAAVLWGVWLPARLRHYEMVDVLALSPSDRPRARGVVGRRAYSAQVTIRHGHPIVAPAELWVQLGTLLEPEELVTAGDSLVRRKNPPMSMDELVAATAGGSGRGIVRARRALPDVREGADSARETRLRVLLVRAGLPEPEVNGIITLSDGEQTHGDLVLRQWRVLVEYDGRQHRTSRRQFERDVLRLERLAAEGWVVIRVLSVHLDDERAVVHRVVRAMRARGWRGRLSRGQFWLHL